MRAIPALSDRIVPAVEHVEVSTRLVECEIAVRKDEQLREALGSENPVCKVVGLVVGGVNFAASPDKGVLRGSDVQQSAFYLPGMWFETGSLYCPAD